MNRFGLRSQVSGLWSVVFGLWSLVFCLWSLPSLAQTEISWDIETSKNVSVPRDIRRGENLVLLPRFLSYGVVTQLTNSASVELYYRSADMSNGLYYVRTGSVHSATGGIGRILWPAAACGTATNYTYDIVVQTNSVVCNLRGFGTIRLLDGVYSQATTATNPTSWRTLDWSTVSNLNLGSAPFATTTTAVASYLTISGQPSDSTSLVAYVAAQVSGISGSTATTIVHNVTDAGFVATSGRVDAVALTITQHVAVVSAALSNYVAAVALLGTNAWQAGDLAGSQNVAAVSAALSNYVAAVALLSTNAWQAGDLAGSQNVAAVSAALSNYVAAVALLGTNAWQAGDLAGSQNVAAVSAALSNYVAAVALLGTNAWQAGDLAGSQYVAQVVSTNVAADTAKVGGNAASNIHSQYMSGARFSGQTYMTNATLEGTLTVSEPGVPGFSTTITGGGVNIPINGALATYMLKDVYSESIGNGGDVVAILARRGFCDSMSWQPIFILYDDAFADHDTNKVFYMDNGGAYFYNFIDVPTAGFTNLNSAGTNAVRTAMSGVKLAATTNADYSAVSGNTSNILGIAGSAFLTNCWGFTDPQPTSATYNVQWTAFFAATGTMRGVRGNTGGGTVVADVIKRFWTNASSSYTTIWTGATFVVTATNIPFTAAIAAGDKWGIISTNVTSGTNWEVNIEWTP